MAARAVLCEKETDLHISRRRDSSSLLPIGDPQAKLFPSTEEAVPTGPRS